jgi:hypothetical protein
MVLAPSVKMLCDGLTIREFSLTTLAVRAPKTISAGGNHLGVYTLPNGHDVDRNSCCKRKLFS